MEESEQNWNQDREKIKKIPAKGFLPKQILNQISLWCFYEKKFTYKNSITLFNLIELIDPNLINYMRSLFVDDIYGARPVHRNFEKIAYR